MRRILLLVPLVLVVACRRPEVEAFARKPTPIVVSFSVPASVPNAEDVKREYAAALRARLATRTTVVPEGVVPPPGAATMRVEITELRPVGAGPSPGTVGALTGVAVGTLSALAGNRDAVFDGFFWGLWAASEADAHRRDVRDRLGYRPQRVEADLTLEQPGIRRPLLYLAVEPWEVIESMDPLGSAEREDPVRVREEEAKAFARVVVFKIQECFQWMALAEPRWFGDGPKAPRELMPEPEPELAPEPAPAEAPQAVPPTPQPEP